MRAAASGSRARTRELGYADAMAKMGGLLYAEADAWRKGALESAADGEMSAAAAEDAVAALFDRYARHALDVFEVYVAGEPGRFTRAVEHLAWLEGKGYGQAAPRELPGGAGSAS